MMTKNRISMNNFFEQINRILLVLLFTGEITRIDQQRKLIKLLTLIASEMKLKAWQRQWKNKEQELDDLITG